MPATDSEIDALFQLPLEDFTPARNALAAKLKKAGRDEQAAEVKALAKPPFPAWLVNQLYWRHRKAFDALMDAGERFRKAQAARLRQGSDKASPAKGPADLQAPLEARREALSALLKHAAALMKADGHAATSDTQRRITNTLEALASYGRQAGAPAAGRLTDDVQPPGFEVLAGLNGAKGATRSRVIPFRAPPTAHGKQHKASPAEEKRQREREKKAEQAAAKKALADAQRTLADARKAAARAEAALKKAAARAKQADKARTELEGRFEKASAEGDAARQDARRVASRAEEAAQAVTDAELNLLRLRRSSHQSTE